MPTLSRNGTDGRLHVPGGELVQVAALARAAIEEEIRWRAILSGARTLEQAYEQPTRPGCYMVVGLNTLVLLALKNGQPLTELANSMAQAFQYIADNLGPDDYQRALTEEIAGILDKELHGEYGR